MNNKDLHFIEIFFRYFSLVLIITGMSLWIFCHLKNIGKPILYSGYISTFFYIIVIMVNHKRKKENS